MKGQDRTNYKYKERRRSYNVEKKNNDILIFTSTYDYTIYYTYTSIYTFEHTYKHRTEQNRNILFRLVHKYPLGSNFRFTAFYIHLHFSMCFFLFPSVGAYGLVEFVQSGVVFYLHCLVSIGEGGVRARFGSRKTGLSSPVVRIVYNAASLSVPRRLPTFSSLYICNLSCPVHLCVFHHFPL